MDPATRPGAGRRRLLAIAGAVVLAALTAPAAAAMPPMDATSARADTRPRTPLPAFILDKGRYTGFDAPGAVMQTGAAAINNLGKIAGNYVDADGAYHGFLRDRRGRFTTVDVPGALATQPSDINDLDQVVGTYSTTARQPQAPDANPRGFLLDRGRFTRIDVPGALLTRANGINNRRQVVGEYVDRAGSSHGFLWDRGRVTTFDAPPGPITFLPANNNRGQVVGFGATGGVSDGGPVPTVRGFLLRKGLRGPITPIAFPGAPSTLPLGINDLGQIVGSYQRPGSPPSPMPATLSPR